MRNSFGICDQFLLLLENKEKIHKATLKFINHQMTVFYLIRSADNINLLYLYCFLFMIYGFRIFVVIIIMVIVTITNNNQRCVPPGRYAYAEQC